MSQRSGGQPASQNPAGQNPAGQNPAGREHGGERGAESPRAARRQNPYQRPITPPPGPSRPLSEDTAALAAALQRFGATPQELDMFLAQQRRSREEEETRLQIAERRKELEELEARQTSFSRAPPPSVPAYASHVLPPVAPQGPLTRQTATSTYRDTRERQVTLINFYVIPCDAYS